MSVAELGSDQQERKSVFSLGAQENRSQRDKIWEGTVVLKLKSQGAAAAAVGSGEGVLFEEVAVA